MCNQYKNICSLDISNCRNAILNQKPVILIDDISTKFYACLLFKASSITEENICFMVNETRSVICVSIKESHIEKINLPMMTPKHSKGSLEFTVSVEAREGVTTGISAKDRATTIRTLAKTTDIKKDLVVPGHIFPVKAKKGGVLVRTSISEALIDLMNICEVDEDTVAFSHILDKNGDFQNLEKIKTLSKKYSIPIVSISEIITKRLSTETILEKIATTTLPLEKFKKFKAICFTSNNYQAEHLVLIKGDIENSREVLVRVQSENRLYDLLRANSSKNRLLIESALYEIEKEGTGVFVYIRKPRQSNLKDQVKEIKENEELSSKVLELREYAIGAEILSSLGVKKITLLSNSSNKAPNVKPFGIEIKGVKKFKLIEETL